MAEASEREGSGGVGQVERRPESGEEAPGVEMEV